MSPNLEMAASAGGFGRAFGRLFSGESVFLNTCTARGGPGMIAGPGKVALQTMPISSFAGSVAAYIP